jgi:chromosome segregation ATPase
MFFFFLTLLAQEAWDLREPLKRANTDADEKGKECVQNRVAVEALRAQLQLAEDTKRRAEEKLSEAAATIRVRLPLICCSFA